MGKAREALFAFVDKEGGPVDEAGVDLGESLGVILGEFDALPEF